MKYETAGSLRSALEARLSKRSAESGEGIGRLRKRVVFDRLLSRLAVSAPERWTLKGALALEYRIGSRARTTMDADLAGWNTEDEVIEALLIAAAFDMGDYFTFRIQRVEQEPGASTLRFRAEAELAGRIFDVVIVDVSVGDLEIFEPEIGRDEGFLEFAGIPSADVPVQAVEQQIAEKVHAYTRQYGGQPSSRTKDLIDLCIIALSESPSKARSALALARIFEHRGTHPLVNSLPSPPIEWRRQFRRMATEVGVPNELSEAHRLAASLVEPLLNCEGEGRWSPDRRAWLKAD